MNIYKIKSYGRVDERIQNDIKTNVTNHYSTLDYISAENFEQALTKFKEIKKFKEIEEVVLFCREVI